ncbi:MAG: tail fiber domain-containing protein [Alphaproteobacteria bacterium]|nr:tail fiber domain-containing protein [Alphaproteobacteria bacterium]
MLWVYWQLYNSPHWRRSTCDAGAEGTIVYNKDHKAVQFCDGTDWISMSGNFGGGGSLPALNSAQILVGDASNAAAAVTMSGDATLSNTGVLNIANDALLGPEISAGSITNSHLAGSIALSKLSITGTADGSKFLRDDGAWQAVPSGADNLGNHTATATLNMSNNNITNGGAIYGSSGHFNRSSDHWSTGGFYGVGSLGQLDTHGAYEITLTSNGYRNSSNQWVSYGANGNTGASQIRLSPLGNIVFSADATKATGSAAALTPRMTIASNGAIAVPGTITAGAFVGDGSGLTGVSGADNLGAGGTTTGTLYSSNASGYGYIGSEGGSTGAYMRFDGTPASSAGNIYVNLLGTWEYRFNVGYFGPYATNLNDLGSSTVRWKDGYFAGNVNAAAYLHTSDERLKKDIVDIDDPLALINSLRGVHYKWKESDKPAYGLIAQEVEKVMPDAVNTDGQGMKAVEYDQVIGPLIEAVKAQQKEIEALKAEIDVLKSKGQE